MAVRDPSSARELVHGPRKDKERPRVAGWVRAGFRKAFVDNAGLKLVAFILALTLFILVHSDEAAMQPVTVPLRYVAPPEGLTLVSQPPTSVRVTLKGSRRRLKRLDESEINPILVTLTNTGEFVFQPKMIQPLPSGVEVATISPPSISLVYERSTAKKVPIRPRVVGSPAPGFRVEEVLVEPKQLEIRGAESALAKTSELATQPVSVAGARGPVAESERLEVPPFPIEVVVDGESKPPQQVEVEVRAQIAPAQGAVELSAVPVEIVGADPSGWTASPATVQATLRGPRLTLEKVDAAALRAQVRLYPADVANPAARKAPVELSKLPAGVAVELRPREVELKPR